MIFSCCRSGSSTIGVVAPVSSQVLRYFPGSGEEVLRNGPWQPRGSPRYLISGPTVAAPYPLEPPVGRSLAPRCRRRPQARCSSLSGRFIPVQKSFSLPPLLNACLASWPILPVGPGRCSRSGAAADPVPYRIGTRSAETVRKGSHEHRRRIRRLAQDLEAFSCPSLCGSSSSPHLDVFHFEAPRRTGPEPRAPRRLQLPYPVVAVRDLPPPCGKAPRALTPWGQTSRPGFSRHSPAFPHV